MRRFLAKALLLVFPFAVYFLVVIVVDPFGHFGVSTIAPARKERVASRMHYPLWRAHEFARSPQPRIVLGDSRMDHLPLEEVEQLTGTKPFNFSFGGGTIAEAVAAFWFAAQRARLEEVTFGLSFFNFNARESMNRFDEAQLAVEDPRFYLINRAVARGTFALLLDAVRPAPENPEAPPMSPDEFWRYQLDVGAHRLYSKYVYPDNYERDLSRIAAYCSEHEIKLVFVIPPSHVELQAKVGEFGLDEEQRRFREFLTRLGPTIDFDLPTDLTRDRTKFGDPFHPSPKARVDFVREIWSDKPTSIAVHSRPEDFAAP